MKQDEVRRAWEGVSHLYRDDSAFWTMVDNMVAHDSSRTREHHACNLAEIIAQLDQGTPPLPVVEIVKRHGMYPSYIFDLEYLEAKKR